MTLVELLKSAGLADEVIAGLPKEVASSIESHLADADTKFANAATAEQNAVELRRLAEAEKLEVHEYVEKYGTSLTKLASSEAENKALKTYLESLKGQGFAIEIPGAGAQPVVPGSPAIGANAVNTDELLGKVGNVISQFIDVNNEHIRLYGSPLPDDSTSLANEARRAKMSLSEYVEKKYKFADKRQERTASAQKEHDDKIRKDATDEAERKFAEKHGSNPNLRSGEQSRNTFVPKIKTDEFQKSSGNMPQRERMKRVIDGVHKDLEAARTA